MPPLSWKSCSITSAQKPLYNHQDGLPQRLPVLPGHARRQGDVPEPLARRQRRLAEGVNQQGVVVRAHRAGGEVTVKDDPAAEFIALKHESRILGHSSNPVCGFLHDVTC